MKRVSYLLCAVTSAGSVSPYPFAIVLYVCIVQMSGVGGATKLIIVFTLSCAGLLGLSYYVSGSWAFLRAVYGVM